MQIQIFRNSNVLISALTLLVGWQEGHPACKNPWRGCGGGGAINPVGVVPTRTVGASASIILPCSVKIQRRCFFRYQPTWVVPDQRPLNGCCCCCNQALPKASRKARADIVSNKSK